MTGECHGTFVTNFYQDEPREGGLKELPTEPYGFIGNVTLTTLESFTICAVDDVQKLVDAAFEASRLFKHEPVEAMDICMGEPVKLLKLDGRPAMERLYGILRDELSEQPIPTPDGIANTRRMALLRMPELGDFNPLVMWDLSFAREAIKNSRRINRRYVCERRPDDACNIRRYDARGAAGQGMARDHGGRSGVQHGESPIPGMRTPGPRMPFRSARSAGRSMR